MPVVRAEPSLNPEWKPSPLVPLATHVTPGTIPLMKGMQFDRSVAARMRTWNPQTNMLDREAVIRAWIGATNFDRWWIGKIAVCAEVMRKQGFVEVLDDVTGVFEWKRVR